MPAPLQVTDPIVIPAQEERTYDKLWIANVTLDLEDPNGEGSATVELHPYCELPDGTIELAPRNPRRPVRRVKHLKGILTKLRNHQQAAAALETLQDFLRTELEASE